MPLLLTRAQKIAAYSAELADAAARSNIPADRFAPHVRQACLDEMAAKLRPEDVEGPPPGIGVNPADVIAANAKAEAAIAGGWVTQFAVLFDTTENEDLLAAGEQLLEYVLASARPPSPPPPPAPSPAPPPPVSATAWPHGPFKIDIKAAPPGDTRVEAVLVTMDQVGKRVVLLRQWHASRGLAEQWCENVNVAINDEATFATLAEVLG